MATFQKRGARWRAIVRKKGHPSQSKTFSTKARAQAWAREVEGLIEDGEAGLARSLTLGEVLDFHMSHLERTSSRGRRNKTADNTLRTELGAETLVSELDFESLKTFCITRIEVDGVKPSTTMTDIMHLSGAITTNIVEERLPEKMRATMSVWREGLKRAGLIGSPEDRDRRLYLAASAIWTMGALPVRVSGTGKAPAAMRLRAVCNLMPMMSSQKVLSGISGFS